MAEPYYTDPAAGIVQCGTEHGAGKPHPAVAVALPDWPVCAECLPWVTDPRHGFDVQPLLLPLGGPA